MYEPFIRNAQYNVIKKQADTVLHALRAVGDPKILETVRYSALTRIMELFPDITDHRKTMLESISDLKMADDFHKYLQDFEPYLLEFPQITEKQIRKLFPKNKKLQLPNLAVIDYRYVSYLSWTDISTNKMYIVYDAGGQFIGVEGRFTTVNKKSYCFVCNRYEELVFFSAITKKRPAQASPDYYKSIGNYICMNGHECNKNITDISALEKFIDLVIG
ncbi:FusB/FusC family EF-G-binding protein [Paenibacillus sinopodophylli]|uniref:FusB/FusC family EF-G-binding protein n=1 Tax=Paenibacillus sinopodophylli TaxID=1837342 RepID=UPI00110D1E6C|nr:FusB/FusC family EF-G-binding protein [Paenibacillus sinopodophylli]